MFRKEVKRLLAVLLILLLMGGVLPGWDYSIKAYAEGTASGSWSDYIIAPALDPADATNKTYTIASGENLAWVASQINSSSNNPVSGYTFNVTSDIDLSAHYWIPIGKTTASYAFKGTFNGNNKVISGLTIGSSAAPNATIKNTGLFGFVSGGTITGVNLDNAVIYSSFESPNVGGLVGEVKGITTISNCSVTGLFICSGSGGRIGGMLGNYNDFNAGKLTVTNCYSHCAIYSPKVSYAGGLIASVFSSPDRKTNIRNCFATGSITGGGYMNTSVGGFIGSCQYANIYNCFTNSIVNGKSCETGGLAGLIYKSSLSNVYAAGLVNNVYTEGGVVGNYNDPANNFMSNCYWNKTVNAATTTYGAGIVTINSFPTGPSNDYTTAEFQADMQSSAFLNDLNANATALVSAGNTDILSWELNTSKNSGFPRLSGVGIFAEIYKPVAVGLSVSGTARVKETLTLSYNYLDYNGYPESGSTIHWYRSVAADGSGAEQIPGAEGKTYVLTQDDLSKYIYAAVMPSNGHTAGDAAISSCTSQVDVPYFAGGSGVEGDPYIIENLAQLKSLTLFPDAHYRLENDITGLDEVLCDGFASTAPFKGDFNGNGHTVTIDITSSTGYYLGMFSVIESSGKVHDLNVAGSVSGSKNIGSLAGLNKGTISKCKSSTAVSATGSSVASIYVGGLVSSNMGRITDCDVTGTLTTSGLTGMGTASSRAVFGGIAGENYCLISEGLITGCYTDIATFSIEVSTFKDVYAGGLVGNNYAGGSIKNSRVLKGPACSLTTVDETSIVRVGGIAGYNYYAGISQCYVNGNVTAGGKCAVYAGGIAGQCSNGPISQPSTISECYYWGTVSGNGESTKDTCAGGLIGYFTSGNVNYCYSTGGVKGNGGGTGIGNVYTGGLIGYGDQGVMRYCYCRSSGTAEGGSTAYNGGLYGGRKNTSGSYLSDCYWNSDNTTATYGDGKNKDSWPVGKALTTIQMTRTQAALDMPLLDFEAPYFIARENYHENWYYPQLQVFANSSDSAVSSTSLESVTEVVYSASISPGTVSLDLSNPEDVSVEVNWNDATDVTDIKADGVSIGTGSYSIDKDQNLLTIAEDYLKTQDLGIISLTVEFNKGYAAVLNINIISSAPVITASPEDKTVTEGGTVSFTVAAVGAEPLSYQWLKNGSSLSDDGRISGANTEKLTISGVQESDEGSYACLVSSNTGNAASSAAALTVNPAPAAPCIITQPSSIAVDYWETATFAVEASGDGPMSYQWLKDGSGISDGSRISGTSTETLNITDVRTSDEGSYTCRVSNGAGDTTSEEAILTVNLVNAAISPSEAAFDLDEPSDIITMVSWGSARTVVDVVYGTDNEAASAVFSIDDKKLTIDKAFLESLELSENTTVDFEIIFDVGDSATLTVEAVRNYIPGSDATLSKLAIGEVTVSDFEPDQYEYYVELQNGTKPGSSTALVSAVPADPRAKLSINQALALPGDAVVTVTSEDESITNIYTIHVTLEAQIPTYAFTITAGTGGSITSGSSGNYEEGTVIDIAASANANYSFSQWTSTGGGTFGSTTSAGTTFTMPANDVTITANFIDNTPPSDEIINIAAIHGVTAPAKGAVPVSVITETAQYNGSVEWQPADSPFEPGTVYTAIITLIPKAGYTLNGVAADFFTVADAASVSNAADSAVITAVFPATAAEEAPVYALTVTAGAGGSIISGSSGNYEAGTVISITATASANYSFNHWTSTNGGAFANAYSSSTTFTMPEAATAITANFTYTDDSDNDEDGDNSGGNSNNTPSSSSVDAVVSGSGSTGTTLNVNFNTNTGNATVDIGALNGNLFTAGGSTVITVPSVSQANNYTVEMPKAFLSGSQVEGSLILSTEAGSITMSGNMLSGINGDKAGITIGQHDKASLPEDVKAAIGDRPLVQLTLTVDGKQTEWNNPDAPVTVSVPYTPTAEELADPEHITVWYIDGSGRVVSVPSGRYDAATGEVIFSTTHFSNYAVVYVAKTFNDLGSATWAKKPIEVLASKGVLRGVSEKEYAPHNNITRAEFLYFLVRTLGIDARVEGNFDDISKEAYYYKEIGTAKKLGITEGIGNNSFNPDESISRQDMMVMTEKALRITKRLKLEEAASALDKFADRPLIASYAVNSVAAIVKEGLIVGSGNKLNPLGDTTRAEAAVFLYRLYNKFVR